MNIDLSKKATTLWAKKRSEDGQQYWLPLIAHLIDTQSTINWLFYHWLCEGQRQILMGDLSDEATQKLIKFVGFIHDIGKATPAFQKKDAYNDDEALDEQIKIKLAHAGFDNLDEATLSSANKSPHALAGEAIVEQLKVPESIGAVIGGHHGKPADSIPDRQIEAYTANYGQSESDLKLQELWEQVRKEIFDYGLISSGYQTVGELPIIKQPQAVILEGLLIMADWLASSEYLNQDREKPLFPLVEIDESWQTLSAQMTKRFRRAIKNWNIGGQWRPAAVDINNIYKDHWGFDPHSVQKLVMQAISETVDPGIAILEAPMGSGKTESALVTAEQLAKRTGRNGVFFGLPTQATTNAMFERVIEWLRKIAETQSRDFSIELAQSKRQFDETYQALPNAADVAIDEDEHDATAGTVTVNEWFSGKKSILTKFTVGTIDNLLLMGLKQKHLFLRHLGFTDKVVIIDEVHAYDAYMDVFLCKALTWLGVYRVPVVILSATLPKATRNLLLSAYLKGKYGNKYKDNLIAPDDWEETQAYPLLSIVDGNQIKQVQDFSGEDDQKPVNLQVSRLNVADEDLITAVIKKISAGGIAGIIVNTVKRAQTLAKLVPKDIKLMVLHASFLATERTTQEKALQAAIGKHGQRPTKMIVIGTQVLEQSLDIDFDILYTDIAPMDLILQRAGRLHRHPIERPKALQKPEIVIMGIKGPNDYEVGSKAVYGQYLLMKTACFLPDTIKLPDDISTLVQKVYDPQTDHEVPDIATARSEYDDALTSARDRAKVFQIKNPKHKLGKTIHGWLSRSQAQVDVNEQKASAAVRDIKETLEVVLIQHTATGNFLLDGRSLEQVTSKEVAQQLVRIPVAITPYPKQVDEAITELETKTARYFAGWQSDVWLKGALALPLDEHLSASLGDFQLTYSSKFGLSYVKEGDHE